ncbi:MAG: hypothetical protein H0X71_09480 [Rubrobacter sp.]|nr:hypothetical protein [Rubrobacter sp.]
MYGRLDLAAMLMNLGIQAYNSLCRWAEETDILVDPVLAEILKDVR